MLWVNSTDQTPIPSVRSERPRLLVVDDSPEIQLLFANFLADTGYEIQFVSNGPEALAAMDARRPDLVLLDVDMEGMSGYEVCERMQRELRLVYVPVVFVTGMEEREHRWRAFAAGASDYLAKPVERDSLIETVRVNLETSGAWGNLEASGVARPQTRRDPRAGSKHPDLRAFLTELAEEEGLGEQSKRRLLRATPSTLWESLRSARIRRAEMGQRMATFLGLKFIAELDPEQLALGVLPPAFCRANSVVPVTREGGGAAFVMSNPFDVETLESLRFCVAQAESIEILVAENEAIVFSDKQVEPGQVPLLAEPIEPTARYEKQRTSTRTVSVASEPDADLDSEVLEQKAAQAPVVRLVDEILSRAVELEASDVHVEPHRTQLAVRYRRDGLLEESDPIPVSMAAAVVSRIKILSNLDIAERRLPQDGHARISIMGRDVDMRISTLPTRHGEKVVLRVLDRSVVELDYAALGLDDAAIATIREAAALPNGILLITGPTGSGKTTTLYTLLNDLNKREANIVTVEDPVELELDRVSQVEVRPELGLDFPSVLRSVLRQDPDIILVGEIRDRETADIAVKAALSGHLVLSTLHTNDAASSIARLVDMGVEPFLLAAAIRLVAAQRLVRTLCGACKVEIGTDKVAPLAARLGVALRADDRFFRAVGCRECRETGYRGRTAIVELLRVKDEIRDLVADKAGAAAIRDAAVDLGMTELIHAGFDRARAGVTSVEEVVRMVGVDSVRRVECLAPETSSGEVVP